MRTGLFLLLLPVIFGAGAATVYVKYVLFASPTSPQFQAMSLAARFAAQRFEKKEKQYKKLQQKLSNQQQDAESAVKKAHGQRERVERLLEKHRKESQTTIVTLHKQLAEAEKQVVITETEFIETTVIKEVFKEDPKARSLYLNMKDAWMRRIEIERDEKHELEDQLEIADDLIADLKIENLALQTNLSIVEERLSVALDHIHDLEGWKIRWGPTIAVGAMKGLSDLEKSGWPLGLCFGVGISYN